MTSRKETIEATLQKMGAAAGAQGELWLVIFGHGSARGDETTVNLPGPDLSGGELAAILDRLPVEKVVIANASSASGDFVRDLSAPGRAIVTATRAVTEKHAPVFGGFFSEGFADNRADVDKDQRVSLLEAFDYARVAVARSFEERWADGDRASHARRQRRSQRLARAQGGRRERRSGRQPSVPRRPGRPGSRARPSSIDLQAKKSELEDRIAQLRAQRASHDEELYLKELETLLLDLARTNEAIDRLAAPKEKPG